MKKANKTTTTDNVEALSSRVESLKVSDEAIRERAYHIYLNTGSFNEHDNWVQAEQEQNSDM